MKDPYVSENGVLINKVGILHQSTLELFEREEPEKGRDIGVNQKERENDMASQFNLIADIAASEEIREKLAGWANDELSKDERERLAGLCEDAECNAMGFLPFVIDNGLEGGPEDFAWRAFCDGAVELDSGDVIRLYFHAFHDACCDLWEYVTERYTGINAVRVYVDPEYEADIDELGEEDLFNYSL